jgi:mono/diheme cytochrome c family protein
MNPVARILMVGLCSLGALPAGAADPIDFPTAIQPIFQRHCTKCHGAEEQNGGVDLRNRTSIFAEADSGNPPVVANDAAASELIKRVTATDENLRMPPEGDPLSAQQIDLLKAWVSQGASWPQAAGGDARGADDISSHWSLQPIANPQPPEVDDSSWASNPIDRFIQARRSSAGMKVGRDAEPVVLIRRATYGLTGLPPTPDEVDRFLAAARSPRGVEGALADLVDELLARSSYGERWGRHWMDWVRYADTAGDNSDFPIPQAYLYRNYIIDAFNDDLPYDRFLTEQIAGDLLPAETQAQRNRQTIATGYLAMSRRFGSLVERYPWHLTIEDSIDNLGRTVLASTIACARCHDHKFDPISTREYYGLYGIFASTQYPFPGIELFQMQRDFVPLIPPAQATEARKPYQADTDRLTAELEKLLAACRQRALENAARESQASLDEQRNMQDELDAMLIKARRAGERLAEHLKKMPPIPSAYAVQDAEPHDAAIQIKGEPTRPGAEVPRGFPDVFGGQVLSEAQAQAGSGRLQLARWITSRENPRTARVIVNRVWQRHFGTGIVPSTSDFGMRGEAPTHPELLDWLAGEFIRNDWSIKQLHRTIMSSHTYRLASADIAENLKYDPENTTYWKFNRQRLDAESIRDTLLMISGALDVAPLDEPHPIPPPSQWKYTQHHPFHDDYASRKRSVYSMTKRLTTRPYLQTFDGPDPNVCTSDREESVTPLQALYFMNDEFLHEQAGRLAASLVESTDDDPARLTKAFRTILCREPSPQEAQLMLRHLAAVRDQFENDAEAERQAWSSLVRTLLRLNEFLYVD